MLIKILFFAQFADLAGKIEETRPLTTTKPEELYAQLKDEYGFTHTFTQIQVAINHQLSAHTILLNEGDEIAFLPPMTGG